MGRDEVPEKEPMNSPESKKCGYHASIGSKPSGCSEGGRKEKKSILSRKRKFMSDFCDGDGKVNNDGNDDDVDALSEDCMAPSRDRSPRRKMSKMRSRSRSSSCGPRGRSKSRAGMKRKSSPRRKNARMSKAQISKDSGFKKFLEEKMCDFAVKKEEAKRNSLKSWCAMNPKQSKNVKPRKSKAAKSGKPSLSCG